MTRRSGPVLVEETIDYLPSVSIEDRQGLGPDWNPRGLARGFPMPASD